MSWDTTIVTKYFSNKLDVDHRNYLATFHLPGLNGEYAIYPPQAAFWSQVLVALCIMMTIQMAYGAVIYALIVKMRGTLFSFFVGYGVVIPTAICIPFYLLDFLQVRNKAIKLSFTTVANIPVFRVLEAMYGTSPSEAEGSLQSYITHYQSLAVFEWDPKTKQRRGIRAVELCEILWKLFSHFHILSILLSIAMHYRYELYPSQYPLDSFSIGWHVLTPSHVANCYLLALVTFYTLGLTFQAVTLCDNIQGYYTKPVFHNPLFTSRSPSEFWGRKWNMIIHHQLRTSVFEPARLFFSFPVCVLLTFFASGLLHDYSWQIVFYDSRSCTDVDPTCPSNQDYNPVAFKVTSFFLWNGAVMLAEHHWGHLFRFMSSWPTLVRSQLVLLLALPISHWFTGDWAVGGFFSDLAMGLWTIRKIG